MKKIKARVKELFSDKAYAIFNNGSSIVSKDFADIDFTIIVKDKKDIRKVINFAKKTPEFDRVECEDPYFNLYLKGKKPIDISIFHKKHFDSIVNNLFKKDFLKLQNIIQHKVVNSVPVYDPKKLLSKYKKKVKYPKNIQEKVFSESLKCLESYYYNYWDLGFKNEFHFMFEMNEIIEYICYALYAKNKKFCMLPFKGLHKDLKMLKPNIEKEMLFLVKGGNSNLAKKKVVLKKIIDKLN
ncbi:hypothetical protein HOC80_00910 [archaeon]|jgi:hypothetical protein|nr:hypothetical protein [archaeon]MBT4416642.1 hypothetical protein [archaeon]